MHPPVSKCELIRVLVLCANQYAFFCGFERSNSHLPTNMQKFCMFDGSNTHLLNYITASGCENHPCCCMIHVEITATDLFSPMIERIPRIG